MYERMTDRARKVLQLANREAQQMQHEFIGTEDVLLGLVREGQGVAANVLREWKIDLENVKIKVDKLTSKGSKLGIKGRLPNAPQMKKIIDYAIEEAKTMGHEYVGTEHLLLGLLRDEEGIGGQALRNLNATLDDIRERVLVLLRPGDQTRIVI